MLGETSLFQDAPATVPSMGAHPPVGPGVHAADGQDEPKVGRVGGLVLTRHLGESIMIGDEVEVIVVGIKAGTVRLKVVAPRTIPVHRREVYDAIRSGSVVAMGLDPVAPRPGKPGGGLVLARTAWQSIMIGEGVELAVVEVRPSTVKLKISAPRSVAVHRREVFEAIRGGFA